MHYRWDEFENDGRAYPVHSRYHASLNSRGVIYLNRNVYALINEPRFVILMYDRTHSVIGIKRAIDHQATAFEVKDTPRGKIIRAPHFCRHNRIRVRETLGFAPDDVNHEGILCLHLSKAFSVKRRLHAPEEPK